MLHDWAFISCSHFAVTASDIMIRFPFSLLVLFSCSFLCVCSNSHRLAAGDIGLRNKFGRQGGKTDVGGSGLGCRIITGAGKRPT